MFLFRPSAVSGRTGEGDVREVEGPPGPDPLPLLRDGDLSLGSGVQDSEETRPGLGGGGDCSQNHLTCPGWWRGWDIEFSLPELSKVT